MSKNIKFILSVFLIINLTTIYSFASEPNLYAKGLQAEQIGDISLAVENYKKSATQGLSDSKFALGRLYRDTYNDAHKSFKWFLDAAEQGNSFAQYEVGIIYSRGNSIITVNHKKAKKWLTLAVNRNKSKDASYELFMIVSEEKKQSWLLKAAQYGSFDAMKKLSEAYQNGSYGLSIDDNKSTYWRDEANREEE